jgi:hypothetical protein
MVPILAACELRRETRAKLSAVKQSCQCFDGISLAELARMHITEPRVATRTALLTLPLSTRADALAALNVLAADADVDTDLCARLIAGLREFIAAR